MANEWWNQGRVQQAPQRTTLDIVEQLARIGKGLGDSVKTIRDNRASSLGRQMASIIGEGGENYKRLLGNPEVDIILNQFKELKPKIDAADVDTIDQYEFIIEDIKAHKKKNIKYGLDKDAIVAIENEFGSAIDEYVEKQGAYGETERGQQADILKEIMLRYVEKKQSFMSYFPDRVKNDSSLVSSIVSVENYANFALDEILTGHGHIDPFEHDAIKKGLLHGDLTALADYKKKDLTSKTNLLNTYTTEIREINARMSKNQTIFNYLFPAENELEVGDSAAEIERKINDAKGIFNLLATAGPGAAPQLDWFQEVVIPWDDMADKIYTKQGVKITDKHQIYHQIRDYVRNDQLGLRGLEENLVEVEQKYFDTSGGHSYSGSVVINGVKQNLSNKQIHTKEAREKISSTFQTILEENTNYPSMKTSVEEHDIKDIYNLYSVIKEKYKGASISEKRLLAKEWQTYYNKIENIIKSDNEAKTRGFITIDDWFGKDKIKKSLR